MCRKQIGWFLIQNLAVKLKSKWTITCSLEHLDLFLLCSIFWAFQSSLDQRFLFFILKVYNCRYGVVFFTILTSCKCDSGLARLLTFPWKQWWHMLFNSFSDMTLMVCVETIVIKPRNISRKLVKQTYEVCPLREGYYHYNYLCKWLIYPNTLQYKAMNKQVVEQELIIIKQNAAWYPYTLVKKRNDAMIWCSIFLT